MYAGPVVVRVVNSPVECHLFCLLVTEAVVRLLLVPTNSEIASSIQADAFCASHGKPKPLTSAALFCLDASCAVHSNYAALLSSNIRITFSKLLTHLFVKSGYNPAMWLCRHSPSFVVLLWRPVLDKGCHNYHHSNYHWPV